LEALKTAGDVLTDRLPRSGCVARLERVDDVLMLAHETLHVAGPPAVGRTSDLLMIAEPAISLGKRRVVRERDQFNMKPFVQRDEVTERLERRAVRSRGDQPVDGLKLVERLAVATLDCKLGRAHLDDEPRFEELPQLVVSRTQSDAVALVALEGDKTLGMKTRQGFADRNEARAKDLRKLVDDDSLAIGKFAVGDQPVQFVVRKIDKASERDRRNRSCLIPGGQPDAPEKTLKSSEKADTWPI